MFTQSSYTKANSANILAQAAFDYANTIGNNVAFSLFYTGSVPLTNKGASGDRKGYVYLANNYFYYCTATYDGTTNVWSRISASSAW